MKTKQLIKFLVVLCFFNLSNNVLSQNIIIEKELSSEQTDISSRPKYDQVANFSQDLVPNLINKLTNSDSISNLRSSIWTVGYIDANQASILIKKLLANNYDQKLLSFKDEIVLQESILILGILSRNDNDLLNFILDGTQINQWSERKSWQSELGSYSEDIFVGYSIQALGLNGQKISMQKIEELKENSESYLHKFAGDITQAEFYKYLYENYGKEELWRYLLTEDKSLFFSWIETDAGQSSFDWANQKMSGPVPD